MLEKVCLWAILSNFCRTAPTQRVDRLSATGRPAWARAEYLRQAPSIPFRALRGSPIADGGLVEGQLLQQVLEALCLAHGETLSVIHAQVRHAHAQHVGPGRGLRTGF